MGLDAEECAKAAATGSAAGPADRRRRRRLISEEEKDDGQSMEGPKGEGVGGAPLFDIPELPRGQMLLFELLAAWGDDCLIGLRFVEMFTADGTRPALADIQSNAVDMISGTLRSLFRVTDDGREGEEEDDGEHNGAAGGGRRNSADDEMWLCKYNSEGLQQRRLSTAPIQIAVHFCDPQTLAMIRISNYAGPDGHDALRGVRSLRIWLDDQCIFCGEICCAFPSVAGGDGDDDADSSIGDTILFTTNDEILTRIAANDGAMESADGDTEGDDQIGTFSLPQPPAGGPSVESAALSRLAFSTRPTTGHLSSPSPSPSALSAVGDDRRRRKWSAEVRTDEGRPAVEGAAAEDGAEEEAEGAGDEDTENAIVGRIFHMELLANWGCPDAIGLAGIQFLGPKFEPIADHLAMECVVRCEPSGGDDERPNGGGELTNLLNGANLTCKADQMWLRPQWNAQGPAPMLSFAFAQEICICGVSVWNYNGSPELSYAGVRCARFYANGKPLAIGMDVLFDRCPLIRPLSSRPQTRSIAAFIFQIRLLSSWGDEFYIGLNGLELYNRQDVPIRLRPQNLAAFPESVNSLAGVSGDPRSSDKLIDGVNDTAKAHNMWLTPILPNSCARVFIIFDAPTFVTRIRIFNYRKTPGRGVRHIALSADDLLLCSGAEVPMSSAEKTGILDVSLRDGDCD